MGKVGKFMLDPAGALATNALGIKFTPLSLAVDPWNSWSYIKDDWRMFKHLLIPDMRQDREVNTNAPLSSRRIVYGRARVGMQLVYAFTSGDENEFLGIVGIFCGHPVDEIEEIWLDDKLSTASRYVDRLAYETHDGTQTTASAALIARTNGQWTTDHKLLGVTYIYARMLYDDGAYPAGVPSFRATIKGRKVYDPRTGLTAWSDNPALCAADYMLLGNEYGGMGCSVDEVDMASVIAAANYCDEMVVTPATTRTPYDEDSTYSIGDVVIGTDGMVYQAIDAVPVSTPPPDEDFWLQTPDVGNEKRYTCNGVVAVETTPAQILTKILASMDGSALYSQGTWKIFAGMPATPVATIDESWLNGAIQFQVGNSKSDKINTVTGTYINPLDHWAATAFPAVQVAAYLAEDVNEELSLDMPLDFVSSPYQAQRLARLAIERSRRGMKLIYPCNLKALALAPNDVVYINNDLLGWTNQQFRVLDWSWSVSGGINLTLGQEDPAIYSIDVTGIAAMTVPALTTLPTPWEVPAPADLAASEVLYATNVPGVIKCRVTLSWTQTSYGVSYYEVERYSGSTWLPAGISATTSFDLNDEEPGAVQYRVRAVNGIGAKSEYATYSYTVIGKTAPPPAVDTFLFSRIPGGARSFIWRLSNPPLDLAGYYIRYRQSSSATWDTMLPLHNGILAGSPYETNQLTAGTHTFAIRSVDTSGNLSDPTYIETTVDDPRLLGVIQSAYPQAEGWPGTLTDCEVIDGIIEASDPSDWTEIPASWAAWTSWKSGVASTIVYEYGPIDAGLICTFTPTVTVSANGTATITVATSDDDVTYGSFAAPAQVKSRYCKVRVSVTGATIPAIYGMSIYLDGNPQTEDIEDLDTSTLTGSYRIGTGNVRLPIQLSYSLIKSVQVALQNVGAGWSWELIDKDTTVGPEIKIYNGSGSLADATIDATIKGL